VFLGLFVLVKIVKMAPDGDDARGVVVGSGLKVMLTWRMLGDFAIIVTPPWKN